MTAAIVDGLEVVATEPAIAPIAKANGDPIHFTQIVKLLLADGTERFGCVHCDYSAERIGQVRPHLKAHRVRKESAAVDTLPEDMTIGELFREHQRAEALSAQLDKMIDSRNEWKQRAVEAEKKLATLSSALRGVAL